LKEDEELAILVAEIKKKLELEGNEMWKLEL